MNEKYSSLFTPWKIGNCEIKNRIVQVSDGRHIASSAGWSPATSIRKRPTHILETAPRTTSVWCCPACSAVRDTMGIPGRHWLYQEQDACSASLAGVDARIPQDGCEAVHPAVCRHGPLHGRSTSMMVDTAHTKKALAPSPRAFMDVDYVCASCLRDPQPLVSGGASPAR